LLLVITVMIFIVFIADNIISFIIAVIIISLLLIAVTIISLLGYCGYDIAVIIPLNTTFGFFKIAI
jgi:hypothetical protein